MKLLSWSIYHLLELAAYRGFAPGGPASVRPGDARAALGGLEGAKIGKFEAIVRPVNHAFPFRSTVMAPGDVPTSTINGTA